MKACISGFLIAFMIVGVSLGFARAIHPYTQEHQEESVKEQSFIEAKATYAAWKTPTPYPTATPVYSSSLLYIDPESHTWDFSDWVYSIEPKRIRFKIDGKLYKFNEKKLKELLIEVE